MAAAESRITVPTAQAYYTTSYIFNSSTTSTATLLVWQALSHKLEHHQLPMTGTELMADTGVTEAQLDSMFTQEYYKRHYGFRRFDTVELWRAWAEDTGALYVPAKHDPKPEVVDYDDDEELEDDELEDEEEE